MTEVDKIIIRIILVVVFGFLFVGSFTNLNQEEFVIYKEECRNETIIVQKSCYYDENSLYIDVIKCQEENHNSYVGIQKEVCEQVEVDRIVFNETTYGTALEFNHYLNSAIRKCKGNDKCMKRKWKYYGVEIVFPEENKVLFKYNQSAEDLTTEWLNKNCAWSEGDKNKRYICGDYLVEVKE